MEIGEGEPKEKDIVWAKIKVRIIRIAKEDLISIIKMKEW